nr:Stf0 family sulfotransferase [Rhizobium halophytocola]
MFDGYILCGTPRTGSTLLCDMLASTGKAGRPNSFFRPQSLANWSARWGLPLPEAAAGLPLNAAYLQAAIAHGTAGTGMFGLRLMRENLAALEITLDRLYPGQTSDLARLAAAFGRLLFVHLSRADTLAQAISLTKAEQTGLWHRAADGSDYERLGAPGAPVYDFARLHARRLALEADDAAWRGWFGAEGITPFSVTYEGLAADPAGTVIGLCRALGVPPPDRKALKPAVAKIADQTSLAWAQRYRLDLCAER